MTRLLLLVSFIGMTLFSGATEARELVYSGVSKATQKIVADRFKIGSDNEVSVGKIDKIVKFLMRTGNYESVSAYRKSATKVLLEGISIREFHQIQIQGHDRFSTDLLLGVTELRNGARFDKKMALEAGEKLKAHYGEAGYFNTIIEIDIKSLDARRVQVTYKIFEGNPCKIIDIKFESKNKALNLRLQNRFRSYLFKRLSNKNVDSIRRKLGDYLLDRDYFSAKIEGPKPSYNEDKTESVISFEITEPFAYEIVFKGIEKGQGFYKRDSLFRFQEVPRARRFLPTRSDIMRSIHKREEGVLLNPESTMASRVREYFLSQGYPKVEVSSSTETNERTFLKTMTYKIKPGSKVTVEKWMILGRISRSENYYADFITSNSSSLLQRGYFDREGLELGLKNLVTELKNQGFLKAKIQSSRIEYTGDHGEYAEVSITLDEGPLTQIRKIAFIGNKEVSDIELAKLFPLKSNSPLRLTDLESGLEVLKQHYYSLGFLEMKIVGNTNNTVVYGNKGTQANINVRIYEGPKVLAKRILVEGNTFTDKDVVLKSLSFGEGDVMTPDKIEDSISRINRMGIFSRVAIQFLEEGTGISNRTVMITVEERDPGAFRFGAGANSQRDLTARAFTGVSYNNLFGTARGISLRGEVSSNIADINYLEHRVNVGYLEPFLFGSQIRGRLNVTRSDEVFNVIQTNTRGDLVNVLQKEQINMLLEKQISKSTTLTWTLLSLESRISRERDGFCLDKEAIEDGDPTNDRCGDDFQQVARIGPVIDLDFRNNPYSPSEGSYYRLAVDYATPVLGSSQGIQFTRLDGLMRYYVPLPSKVVWANEVRSGYLANLSPDKNSGVPASYAFFLGGYSTVRGFDFTNEANRIPKGEGENRLLVESATDLLIDTDSYYYMVKTELRFPVWESFGGAIFYDGGSVMISGYDFTDDYRDAIGFGTRINTPVGAVALDLGFKLDQQEDESLFRLHFSITSF